ncbi:MAG: hypothetical protein V1873_03735 [Verrucomicrobiota bacterium]
MKLVTVVAACCGMALALFAQEGTPAAKPPVMITPKTAPVKIKMEGGVRQPAEMPFLVYDNSAKPAIKNFSLSGYMGDVSDLQVMGSYTNLHQPGIPCLKVVYVAGGEQGWGGLVWQNPANNWGEVDAGYNLTRAKKLLFWAKGEKGGEQVQFKMGGMAASHPDSDSVTTGDVKLSGEWTQYGIDLTRATLAYISAGFAFIVTQDGNPEGCTFYLDDVRYEE